MEVWLGLVMALVAVLWRELAFCVMRWSGRMDLCVALPRRQGRSNFCGSA
jgi:hypothetical protein